MRLIAALPLLWACARAQTPPPRGIVLVSMDTLRADHTAPGGAPADATPTLARIAGEGIVFEQAFATANETLLSHGSMFTGRPTSHVAPVDYDFTIPDGTPTLASRMAAAGLRTGAVVASGHLARVFGLDDGFATYAEGQWWGSFQETVPMAVRWLDDAVRAGEPFFLFLHGYDAHNPYVKPGVFARMATPGTPNPLGTRLFDPFFYERVRGDRYYPTFPMRRIENTRGTTILDIGNYEALDAWAADPAVPSEPLTPEQRAFVEGTYRSAVLYADTWMGVLVEELARRGLLETTTLVFVADHGEALLDHGYYNHRHTLRDASTHVPFVVRPAGGVAPVRVTTPVSLLDVAPTLLELAGASPAPQMEGRSLVPCFSGACPEGRMPYAEGAGGEASVTDGAWRLVTRGVSPSDPAFDAALRGGEGLRFFLYERATGEKEDRAGDPALAPVLARLRAGMLAARGAAP
ncbi:MAG: sulfatase [Myxococcota bacterium]